MDRRMTVGLLVLALTGSARTASAFQMKDPSTAGYVGFTPLDSISDRINNTIVPAGSSLAPRVPADPTTSGPPARIPTMPVGPNPVGLTDEPPIHDSVDGGYTSGGFGWFFRRRPQATAAASAVASTRGKPPRGAVPAPIDMTALPPAATWDESGEIPASTTGSAATAGLGAPTLGRPSPYASQQPDMARRQALGSSPTIGESDGMPVAGRPAPLRADLPRQGRPRLTRDGTDAPGPTPRPRTQGTSNPRPLPTADPAPTIPATLPPLDRPETAPAELPRSEGEPAPLPPLGLRGNPGGSARTSAPETIAAVPDPLPEPTEGPAPLPLEPVVASTELPTLNAPADRGNPVAPPSDPALTRTSALGADLEAPPAGLPRVLPVVTVIPPVPSGAGQPAASPVAPTPVTGPVRLTSVTEPVPASSQPDPALQRTSGDPTSLRIDKPHEPERQYASARAAAVGSEVITVHQVNNLVVDQFKRMTEAQEPLSKQDRDQLINMLATSALNHLIDQSLVLQEAKGKMKNAKMKQQFDAFVDKKWRDDKLPALLQKTSTTNEFELRRKLAEEGKDYNEMILAFRNEMLEHDFLLNEIKNKVNADLKQLLAYYNDHLQDFEQPARISWREIEISVSKYPDRAAARQQADAVLARLTHKEDFAAVAQAVSNGPTASNGGLYADMTPGSYGITAVNDVLNSIPPGRFSKVIEAPESFHIVRVESRRAAGPLRFDEVQRRVAEAVFEANFTKAREDYLAKLREKTIVRVMPMFATMMDEQNRRQQADSNVRPAANR